MKKIAVTSGLLVTLFGTACGSGINDALFFAFESSSRTFLDVLVSDFYSDLPNLFTLPPASGEPDQNGDDDAGGGDGNGDINGGLTGEAQAGQSFFDAHSCSACHCADATGGCALSAPGLLGTGPDTLLERLAGSASHPGGKINDITDQEIADLVAFLGQ